MTRPMPGDVTTARVRDEFDELAPVYEERWRTYTERSNEATIRRVPFGPSMRLLDVGAGTGLLLRKIADRFPAAQLTGLDLSLAMALTARRSQGEGGSIVAADAHRLPFEARSFDVVVSSSSIHFWSDPADALIEIRRVLRDEGTLVVTDWCSDYLACRLCDRYLRWRNPAYRPAFSSAEIEALLARSGFEVAQLDRYRISWIWGLMTVAARPVRAR
jgi:ubiquinone/menaquinone biosynthesis C-methylase UbiE